MLQNLSYVEHNEQLNPELLQCNWGKCAMPLRGTDGVLSLFGYCTQKCVTVQYI